MRAQEAVAQAVEGAHPHAAHRQRQHRREPRQHLLGGLVGEGDGHHAGGRDHAVADQPRRCAWSARVLPEPAPADQRRPRRQRHRGELLGVQAAQQAAGPSRGGGAAASCCAAGCRGSSRRCRTHRGIFRIGAWSGLLAPRLTPSCRRSRPLGGGAHGAYTWGVPDAARGRLLRLRRHQWHQRRGDGTAARWPTAGCAAAPKAREALAAFWARGTQLPSNNGWWARLESLSGLAPGLRADALDACSRPTSSTPLGLNPLRDVARRRSISSAAPARAPRLFIAAHARRHRPVAPVRQRRVERERRARHRPPVPNAAGRPRPRHHRAWAPRQQRQPGRVFRCVVDREHADLVVTNSR